ncbi:hypothetical protein E3N88_33148 [Mikania micrantha]|uniref:Uncharacterized protein n=1 Tax=Mikania micrantha TaxID=192012 RepID=A0A5N6LKT3_9ASTR|nr:hypothetical protein E3N88_42154 [Mikania micrantha]KAD3337628.1 hypothetical protein E3N88_33148 [Mikania micrantha]
MAWHVPEDAMPWVGLYCVVASLICTLAMATDVAYGFWQWKLWFPNKFFTLNATTITLIAIAMKLPVDLTSDTSHEHYPMGSIEITKIVSIVFLVTMLANFLPSLGLVNDKELLTNIVALEEYTMFVVQIEDEPKLSERVLRNSLNSINRLLDKFEKKEPKNLMKLLEKSRGFNGVLEYENDQVPPLCVEEIHSCWSLVLVTLTATSMALPNIANSHFKGLLSGMKEGLQIVRHIEECLNVDGDSAKERKAARRVWTEVEVHRTWLQIDLQKKARIGKPSKEILQWLGDEAAKVVIQFCSSKKPSIADSSYNFILASSMYRISQTILLHYNEQENWSNDEQLFEWISTIIADVLLACFTNLPRVIEMKCHHHAIEKRGDNIRSAAQLLGKSKKILKILKARQPFNIDQDSMAYIDKWRAILKSQTPIGSHITSCDASSTGIQGGSSNSNELTMVIRASSHSLRCTATLSPLRCTAETKPPKDQNKPSSSPYNAPQPGRGYPPAPGSYGSRFSALVASTFPPGTDPNVVACFQVADQDGSGVRNWRIGKKTNLQSKSEIEERRR